MSPRQMSHVELSGFTVLLDQREAQIRELHAENQILACAVQRVSAVDVPEQSLPAKGQPAVLAEDAGRLRSEFARYLAAVLREGEAVSKALRAEDAELQRQNRSLRKRTSAEDGANVRKTVDERLEWDAFLQNVLKPLQQRSEAERVAKEVAEREASSWRERAHTFEHQALLCRAESAAFDQYVAAARAGVDELRKPGVMRTLSRERGRLLSGSERSEHPSEATPMCSRDLFSPDDFEDNMYNYSL